MLVQMASKKLLESKRTTYKSLFHSSLAASLPDRSIKNIPMLVTGWPSWSGIVKVYYFITLPKVLLNFMPTGFNSTKL
jgi:hypothetical protein